MEQELNGALKIKIAYYAHDACENGFQYPIW